MARDASEGRTGRFTRRRHGSFCDSSCGLAANRWDESLKAAPRQQKNTPSNFRHWEQSETSISRVLFAAFVASRSVAVIPLGRALLRASCGLPRGSGGQPSNASLRGLAPDGVCRAEAVTDFAVGSYSTVSPLPDAMLSRSGGSLFCGTFLEVSLTGRYPASCPAEPGLSSRAEARASACSSRTRGQ
jgi:hypothetical protein